ncbi:alpha/beta fold hydrolase [Actinomadura macrotermitis]|uniref:AB hydrolase-1 domain-containing protein n=1 Tax=Actinomadura macrotermitis TaxID=2585200 RepID=A0A7K0C676_9ACTN|nr:alpha/beta fold hydrolase [Actinomadura macrotermitis]MQY08971.1 hypothetical protein [Actinomadura macrotermitis]
MADFVLVPGFWLGAWAWEQVAAKLRADGHRVHAVTLTGLAERAGEATPQTDVDTHVGDIVRVVEDNDLREVVLVGHSGANMPVTGAADRIAGRLARVVYVDTAPMPSGMAQVDFLQGEAREAVLRQIAEQGGGRWLPAPSFEAAGEGPGTLSEADLAGLAPQDLALLRERATPEPAGAATQPLERPAAVPATPKSMIMCTMPAPLVRQLVASGNPVFAAMTGPEWSFHELPTGHWPMLSRPVELAALLAELAAAGG